MKEFGKEKDLLKPLVVFQVRGSVSATGGHGPEEFLKRLRASLVSLMFGSLHLSAKSEILTVSQMN